jgi:formylglycine-generating enzyme required for sulfatase activity
VNDWYGQKYYQSSPSQDPSGPASGQQRVQRGGSWINYSRFVRVSNRKHFFPLTTWNVVDGFRCAGEVVGP